jgi:hypothetical protein
LKATEEALADLLVTDLSAGSSELRKKLPDLLGELQNKDRLVMALAGAVAPSTACKPGSRAPGTTSSAPKRPNSRQRPSGWSKSAPTC